ncbi:MAG: hypothetical protein HY618_02590 [Candidatus Tectomicrobia bacterium]|uniref:DUF7884 domain-containing protein n=1 Tax=Tectimicrobiota bacterium TaxID=2528274 RepID=A0A932ZTG6_UNCTE|nr:hypothetical protein [Candidatus Tectomicrobia bacterium]
MPASPAAGAAEILREIFAAAEYGVTFRLWDGTELRVGRQVCPLTVTFHSPGAFRCVFLSPSVNGLAEAYCDGDLELDGDLILSMRAADAFEEVEIPLLRRILLALKLRSLGE